MWILVIKYLSFITNIITHNIDDCFIKNRNLPVNRVIRKYLLLVERCMCILDISSNYIFTMSNMPFAEDNILPNQTLQIQSDDDHLDVMNSEPHYLQPHLTEMQKQDLCKM